MTFTKNKLSSITIIFALMSTFAFAQPFSTVGNLIRNSVVGSVNNESVIYLSELDGAVSAHTIQGDLLWRNSSDAPAVMFEINSEDINGDGNDDLLAASGNGHIYCWDSSGALLWKYAPNHKVRFSEIAVVTNDDKVQIFAGGNDYHLYELNTEGKLVSSTKIEGVVRKIESGKFFNSEQETLFLMTYAHDKFRWEFMGILDANSKAILKEVSYKKESLKQLSKAMVTDVSIADINNDSSDDILFFADDKFKPYFTALNSNFDAIGEYKGNKKQTQRYAHSQGTFLPSRNEIMFQHGGILIVLDEHGKLKGTSGEKYGKGVYSDFVYEPQSNQLIAAGTVDGGNSVNFYDLNKKDWYQTTHKKQGRMLEVEHNLKELYAQILNFNPPDYQKKSDKDWVMITKTKLDPRLEKLKGNNLKFVIQKSPKESTDRGYLVNKIGKIALKKDRRGKYQDSRESIIQMAKDYEKEGQPFTFWAGHGNDPFYIQIETLEAILEAAPNTCYGFVYAEMDKVEDPRVQHFVKEYLPRLAKAIRNNNRAKLYFRYKNMFWAATSHLPLWKEMFFSGKYNDFLVPASEDTSNRIQDLNLAGRVGMFTGGYVNDFAMRLIDDNPTSWRPLSPGGQNTVSPYLRQGVMMAAYGARYGVVSTSGFVEEPGLNIMFGLMKSGVLPIVEKENIQSISAYYLIKDVDEKLVHTVDTHHEIKQYNVDDDKAVFSVAQMHWAGTNIPEHDFSKVALGVNYRWLNYIPEIPKGMVPIVPSEFEESLKKRDIPYFISDAKVGYINDNKVAATEFGDYMLTKVKQGAENLSVLVEGSGWAAIKIDDHHTRIILLDPGYINPQQREVVIKFQNITPKSATDILSNDILKIEMNQIKLIVPAGSMRFIDVEF